MKFRLQAVLLTILIIGAGLATQLPVKSWADKTGLKTVASVDLSRYMGKWYEIAAIPMYFERNCHGETTAEYTLLPDGLVKVVNSCDTASHKRIAAEGRAKVTDAKTNARLKVTFLNWFGWRWFAGGDYWITDLFEISKEGHSEYYITLENADRKKLMKSDDYGQWVSYNLENVCVRTLLRFA